ncbi:MAG: hypothetical protein R3F53_15175 [Gammaproteobacteria bacterium]
MIGQQLHTFWAQASENLAATLSKIAPQLRTMGSWLLSAAAGVGFGILQFIIAIFIAGFLLAGSEAWSQGGPCYRQPSGRAKGARFARLAESTVRGVTKGILGLRSFSRCSPVSALW